METASSVLRPPTCWFYYDFYLLGKNSTNINSCAFTRTPPPHWWLFRTWAIICYYNYYVYSINHVNRIEFSSEYMNRSDLVVLSFSSRSLLQFRNCMNSLEAPSNYWSDFEGIVRSNWNLTSNVVIKHPGGQWANQACLKLKFSSSVCAWNVKIE